MHQPQISSPIQSVSLTSKTNTTSSQEISARKMKILTAHGKRKHHEYDTEQDIPTIEVRASQPKEPPEKRIKIAETPQTQVYCIIG